jgi:hypothetical protein
MRYENGPSRINAARAAVLTKGLEPLGTFNRGDTVEIQYQTPFGLVTYVADTWGDVLEIWLLRYAQ